MPRRNKATFSAKELLFVQHFAGDPAEAAKLSGYKHPEVQGPRLMRRLHIAAEIQKKLNTCLRQSATMLSRKVDFGRSDIIVGFAKLAGLVKDQRAAEAESVQHSALCSLAKIFHVFPKEGLTKADLDFLDSWTDDEMDLYREQGIIPGRFLGLSAENLNEQPRTSGLSAAGTGPNDRRSDLGSDVPDQVPIAPPAKTRK